MTPSILIRMSLSVQHANRPDMAVLLQVIDMREVETRFELVSLRVMTAYVSAYLGVYRSRKSIE